MTTIAPIPSTQICILGAGGFGREVYAYLEDIIATGSEYRVTGFLDDQTDALNGFDLPVSVIGPLSTTSLDPSFSYIIALGDANLRGKYGSLLRESQCRVVTLVHPTAYVAHSSFVGPGAIIGPFAMVGAHSQVQEHAVLNIYASVGHDAIVGAYSVLSPYATLNGRAVLGQRVFLGTQATVLPSVEIGTASKVSAGTIVKDGVPAGSLVTGCPARHRVIFPETGP